MAAVSRRRRRAGSTPGLPPATTWRPRSVEPFVASRCAGLRAVELPAGASASQIRCRLRVCPLRDARQPGLGAAATAAAATASPPAAVAVSAAAAAASRAASRSMTGRRQRPGASARPGGRPWPRPSASRTARLEGIRRGLTAGGRRRGPALRQRRRRRRRDRLEPPAACRPPASCGLRRDGLGAGGRLSHGRLLQVSSLIHPHRWTFRGARVGRRVWRGSGEGPARHCRGRGSVDSTHVAAKFRKAADGPAGQVSRPSFGLVGGPG